MSTDALKWSRTQAPRFANGNLSPSAKAVLLVVCDHANKADNETFVGVATIATESSLGETAVTRALKLLEDGEYIRRRRRYHPNGNRSSDFITVAVERPPDDLSRPKRQEPPELARSRTSFAPAARIYSA